jgi:hypothetical protein
MAFGALLRGFMLARTLLPHHDFQPQLSALRHSEIQFIFRHKYLSTLPTRGHCGRQLGVNSRKVCGTNSLGASLNQEEIPINTILAVRWGGSRFSEMSKICKIETNEIGSLEKVATERQMEAFLMNNPALLGCGSGDEEEGSPFLLQQIPTRKDGGVGRIDLAGLTVDEGQKGLILKIFELKNQRVTTEDIRQLGGYLSNWDKQGSGKDLVRQSLLNAGLDEGQIGPILTSPKGVSVGPSFMPEAEIAAQRGGFEAIRLTRFPQGRTSTTSLLRTSLANRQVPAAEVCPGSMTKSVKKTYCISNC